MSDSSPLTRQATPAVFKPKVVHLYESLFLDLDSADPDAEFPPGFWRELFLLPADRPALRNLLAALAPSVLLQHAGRTQAVVAACLAVVRSGRRAAERRNGLDTLAVVLAGVLAKKWAHASSDMIAVLAGLDEVDAVFTEMVGVLEGVVRGEAAAAAVAIAGEAGREKVAAEERTAAVHVLLAFAAGAYQTTLPTYLMQRDLFPAVMRAIHDSPSPLPSFVLLGLLANYNKFEFQNPYGLRLADFVNEATMARLARCIGRTCATLRADYVAVQDDAAAGWTLAGALGRLVPAWGRDRSGQSAAAAHDEDAARALFAQLPGPAAAVLLATYDFAHANKLFCMMLVGGAQKDEEKETDKATGGEKEEDPLCSFLSLSSYLLQHAYLSSRASYYAHLTLMVLRLLVEDPAICKRLCSADTRATVRLCRQRPPHLPLAPGPRVLAAHMLDAMADGIAHNLRRRRLDVALYAQLVGVVLRLLSYVSRTRTRLAGCHWAALFRGLLSLLRFMAQYAADLRALPGVQPLVELTGNVLALALSAGEAFLPSPAEYDDLFYKVVESGEALERVRADYGLAGRASSVDTLVDVSAHYKRLLAGAGAGAEALTALQVADTIKQGYETLSIQTRSGLDMWERYREADERTLLKAAGRTAVGDAVVLAGV